MSRLARVLPFPSTRNGVMPEVEWTNIYQVTSFLQVELARTWRSGVKIKTITAKTGLCPATVSNIATGVTKAPTLNTVFVLLKYFGFKLYIR